MYMLVQTVWLGTGLTVIGSAGVGGGRGRGGGSQFRRGARHCGALDTYSIYVLFVRRHGGGTLNTNNMRICMRSS
jgi:hypothetical protein